jgi:flagellum-specific peptidoglycan hydrolase FlgJ
MSVCNEEYPVAFSDPGFNEKLDSVEFSNYEQSADLILGKYKSSITGEMFANSWKKSKLETGIDVPVYLALSQAFLESGLGKSKLSKSNNNPYSIRLRSGEYKKFRTLQEGIDCYYSLISVRYLSCKSLETLLEDFTSCKGYRYAEDSLYEKKLIKTMEKFQNFSCDYN